MQNARFSGYDEAFKILAKHFFEKFSKVITDYEIIKLPVTQRIRSGSY